MKPKIYVTRLIPEEILNQLKAECEVRMWNDSDTPVPREVLEKEVPEVDGLYTMLTDKIDDSLMAMAPNLKIVSNMAVGFNNIDIEAATKRNIMVTNTPGVLSETTADLTFALLMMTARRLEEAANYLREGKWKSWAPMLMAGQDIYGATMGIIGMGRIGEGLARRAKGFDMKVLYHNRNRKPEVEKELGVEYREFEDLLKESDYICLMTPYTPETHNLIDEKELSLMKPTAILINTARGGIVNEDALYKALANKEIWAAGFDVFEKEPISPDHPLLTLPNFVALPHIGSASVKTRLRIGQVAVDNLFKGLKGERPDHLLNPEVFDK